MQNNRKGEPVLIAGAGIGGLSTAIALAREGIPSHVFERTDTYSTHGAGIQLGPNATRILRHWGVMERLARKAVASDGIAIGDGMSGAQLNFVPFGKDAESHYGAPFVLAHRADLHRALLDTAKTHKAITFSLGCEVVGYAEDPDGISIKTTGDPVRGCGLVCVDGIWSRLREHIDPGAELKSAGRSAWRTLLDAKDVPEAARAPWTRLWLAPKAHLVHYPVSGGSKINVVAVIEDRESGLAEGWNEEANASDLFPSFEDWNPSIAQIVRSGARWRRWSLYTMSPLRTWTHGSAVLLGDAAHPMPPFLAQGGAMAIEDAATLAFCVADTRDGIEDAFKRFQIVRLERTARTAYESRRMGNIYHMGGFTKYVRDFVLRSRKPDTLRKKYDWLYGFRVVED